MIYTYNCLIKVQKSNVKQNTNKQQQPKNILTKFFKDTYIVKDLYYATR